jgi:hypothetical protein
MTGTIGGPGIDDTDSLDGEEVLFEAVVRHGIMQRFFGGKLFVTNYRIIFLPFETERILGASSIELLRENIVSSDYTLPDTGELTSAPRAEIHIHSSDELIHHFTIAFYREEFTMLQEVLE